MFENVMNFLKKIGKKEENKQTHSESSKDAAKERLHLVLMQDRANVSADFLELMKQEIIEVIKKYIEVDEKEIDVRLTNKENEDGTNGAPALYANIPILNIKNEARKIDKNSIENKNEEEHEDVKLEKEKTAQEQKENETKIEEKTETGKGLEPEKEPEKDEKTEIDGIPNENMEAQEEQQLKVEVKSENN